EPGLHAGLRRHPRGDPGHARGCGVHRPDGRPPRGADHLPDLPAGERRRRLRPAGHAAHRGRIRPRRHAGRRGPGLSEVRHTGHRGVGLRPRLGSRRRRGRRRPGRAPQL
ncbi:MAG: hypothetical protein AVDCRST_MAG10-1488, partial [uncultured Acidimicrobiales bacterium]